MKFEILHFEFVYFSAHLILDLLPRRIRYLTLFLMAILALEVLHWFSAQMLS